MNTQTIRIWKNIITWQYSLRDDEKRRKFGEKKIEWVEKGEELMNDKQVRLFYNIENMVHISHTLHQTVCIFVMQLNNSKIDLEKNIENIEWDRYNQNGMHKGLYNCVLE